MLAAVVARWSGRDWAELSTTVAPRAIAVAAVLSAVGYVIPLVGPRLAEGARDWRTYRRLGPLERELAPVLASPRAAGARLVRAVARRPPGVPGEQHPQRPRALGAALRPGPCTSTPTRPPCAPPATGRGPRPPPGPPSSPRRPAPLTDPCRTGKRGGVRRRRRAARSRGGGTDQGASAAPGEPRRASRGRAPRRLARRVAPPRRGRGAPDADRPRRAVRGTSAGAPAGRRPAGFPGAGPQQYRVWRPCRCDRPRHVSGRPRRRRPAELP